MPLPMGAGLMHTETTLLVMLTAPAMASALPSSMVPSPKAIAPAKAINVPLMMAPAPTAAKVR